VLTERLDHRLDRTEQRIDSIDSKLDRVVWTVELWGRVVSRVGWIVTASAVTAAAGAIAHFLFGVSL
jgi:hypothetical protein